MDVAQTPEGYLWVGTLLGGLARFDGVRFVTYDSVTTPELRASVRRLCVDRSGALWIATYGSLVRWQNGVFQVALESDSKIEALIFSDARQVVFSTTDAHLLVGEGRAGGGFEWRTLAPPGAGAASQFCADRAGVVWYRHADGSVWRVREGQSQPVAGDVGLAGRLSVLAADGQGRVWAGTEAGLASWDGQRFLDATPTNGEPKLAVRRLTFGRDDSVWVEANGRLRRASGRRWEAEVRAGELDLALGAKARLVKADGAGGLWLSSAEAGLTHVAADGTVRRVGAAENLPGSVVRCLFVDGERDLWVGYERGGLVRVRQRLFEVVGRPEGLGESVISSLCAGADGGLWIGAVGGTVSRWDQGRCTNLALPQLGSRCQFAIVNSDAQGWVWVGTTGNGLLLSEGGGFRHVVPPEQLKFEVRLLLPARDGKVWLAGQRVLCRYANGELVTVREANTPAENFAALAEDPSGALWVGTCGGELLRFSGEKVERFSPPPDLPVSRFWALCPDAEGTLWIGTARGGLLRFREGVFTGFAPSNGLPAEAISQILDDGRGGLWVGTRAGIARVSKAGLESCAGGETPLVTCRTFGRSDGLRTVGCAVEFQPLCARASDGRLWFAMANGVAGVRPEEVPPSRAAPSVLLEGVLLDGRDILPPQFPAEGQMAATLRIAPGRHDLEFRYTGISLAAPEGVRFRYQLTGLDQQWQPAGTSRSAVYRYLPPGEYTFRVSAGNSDGVWSESGAAVGVVLAPFLWQRAWFPWGTAALAGTLITASVVVWLRARTRRRSRLQLERLERQQAVERERTRVAQDLHDDLGAGLTEIGLLGGLLQSSTPLPPERSRQALERIVQRARYLVTALDEIVWAVNPRHDSARSLGGYFCRYAQEFFAPTAIRCRLDFQEGAADSPLNSEQRHNLFLAFKEILTNVVRHSGASEVRVSVSLAEPGRVTVAVRDNGHGLPAVMAEGADGLANLRQRMKHLCGDCALTSLAEGGVEVRLSVPVAGEKGEFRENG
jgi:ligand-binding sensor domain-containing protein/signal transduction histidine kinase